MSNSLYNKYRPKDFESLIGQNVAKQILINSIQSQKINNSYLFYGIRGTGKTTIARIFAKALNCEHLKADGNPCNQCSNCKAIDNNSSFDVIEIDAASNNGVDEIRELNEKINYKATNSKYKVYIIDEVHMLSKSAFNALLKTLEEPPENIVFLLVTTEINKIPDTILSRNIIINLEALTSEEIIKRLRYILETENFVFQPQALKYLTLVAGGSLRDAISFLDKVLLFSKELTEESTIKSLGLIKDQEIIEGLKNKNKLIEIFNNRQLDLRKVILQLIDILTNLIITKGSDDTNLLNDLITLSLNIKDPQLLLLSLKGILVSDLNKNNHLSIETIDDDKELSKDLKNKQQIINQKGNDLEDKKEENWFENEILKIEEQEEADEKRELNKTNSLDKNLVEKEQDKSNAGEIKEEPKAIAKITDYLTAKHYISIMFDSDQETLKKYNKRFDYLNSYLNKNKWKKYVMSLQDSKILVAMNGYLIIGIDDQQKYEDFKTFSLEKDLLEFLRELFGEEVYLLPVIPQTWTKLLAKFNKLKSENKRISEEIFIPIKKEDRLAKYQELFGGKMEIK